MARLTRLVQGLAALVVLAVLVVGVPWALWHFVGWPLPHHVPTATQVGRALDHQGIPAQTLIDALAVVVWLTWAALVASLAVEIPAALAGRRPRHLPVAGTFQPLTGRLVAAVVVACLALAPRPAHPGPPGTLGRVGPLTHRPVAALVVRDTTLTAATTPIQAVPVSAAGPASNGVAAPAATTLAAAAPTPITYTVQRGDTLWGIAERELGDPLRWSQIYAMNEGRPQPGGATLTDPHWIDPGWTLLLPPVAAESTPAAPPPAAPQATPPSSPPSSTSPSSPAASNPAATTVPPATTPHTTVAPPATNGSTPHPSSARQAPQTGAPVRLPSGSLVAGSFAAGVAATIAVGRLRRRHAYRYRPPAPGRNLTAEPLRPTVERLQRSGNNGDQPAEDGSVAAPLPVDDWERCQDPGRLEVASRAGHAVTVELTDLSGVALEGPAVDDVARGLIGALVVRAGPGAAEVLCSDEVAERLLPGLGPNRSVRRVETLDRVAQAVESERVARNRRFEAVGAADAEQFRAENPENPLPLLLVVLDAPPAESLGRWAALVDGAPRLAIAVVFLQPTPIASGTLRVGEARTVLDASPHDRLDAFAGAELFGMRADEAVEVLAALAEADAARDLGDAVDDPHAASDPATAFRTNGQVSDPAVDSWPDTPPRPDADEGSERPVTVRMFGHFEVAVDGDAVVTGLRGRARDLLAWFMLRPEGATSDEAVDALWPDTPRGRVHGQFWRSFSDLRARLREGHGDDLEVFAKLGEHYQPCDSEIGCDLWDFQAALAAASRAEPEQARAALAQAVALYRGDFLAGDDRPWVEPVRQDLHRRALDAHLRLAELEEQAGRSDTAVEALERAITMDRYAEEPYRRLMVLHATRHHDSALREVWRLLQSRLAELDLDVENATASLYRQLTDQPRSPTGTRRLRSVT